MCINPLFKLYETVHPPYLASALLLFVLNPAVAQDKLKLKYGKVTAADFDLTKHKFDTGASAVVIADIGSSRFLGK